MHSPIQELTDAISDLQDRLEAELAQKRAQLRVGMEHGRVVFEAEVLRRHRELKVGLWTFLKETRPITLLVAPVIYSLILPLLALDLFVSLYQAICFPVYGIEKVRRRNYLIFDRHHLAYLNALQKLNCAYCAYANGLLAYVSEIAGRTEQYWCPIKHARRVVGAHRQYGHFTDFGDAEAFRRDLARLRLDLQKSALSPRVPGSGPLDKT